MADPVEQKARERFEKWVKEHSKLELPRWASGQYASAYANLGWNSWQAAERSVVSDIVEKLEKRADEADDEYYYGGIATHALREAVAELKRDYLGGK